MYVMRYICRYLSRNTEYAMQMAPGKLAVVMITIWLYNI